MEKMDIGQYKVWEKGGKATSGAPLAIEKLIQSPFGKTIIAAQMAVAIKKRCRLDDKVTLQARWLDPTREELIKNPYAKIFLIWGDTDQVDFDTDKVVQESEKIMKEYRIMDPKSNARFVITIIRDNGKNNIHKEYFLEETKTQGESYLPDWVHGTLHFNPKTGDCHYDGKAREIVKALRDEEE